MDNLNLEISDSKKHEAGQTFSFQKCRCNSFIPREPILCECGQGIEAHESNLVSSFFNNELNYTIKQRKQRQLKKGDENNKCSSFSVSNINNLFCGCNRRLQDHEISVFRQYIYEDYKHGATKNWSIKEHTIDDGATNAYGDLLFLGFEKISKYVRVSHSTPMSKALELLFSKKMWNLRRPKLLISVTGGTHLLNNKPLFRDTFCKGLFKAATNTNAWVISGGINMGCMKMVGEAFKDNHLLDEKHRAVVLGIANWTTVRGNQALLNNNREELDMPAEYESMIPKKDPNEKSAHLDPYHTHFILIDSVKENEFGGEVNFRANLERAIYDSQKNEVSKSKRQTDLSLVSLVLGGGRNTVRQILAAVEKNVPCIIFDETGKFANIFAFIIKQIERHEDIFYPKPKIVDNQNFYEFKKSFRKQVREQIVFEMRKNTVITSFEAKDDVIEPIICNIEKIFQPAYLHLLSYFVLKPHDPANTVDMAILNGLLKSSKKKEQTGEHIINLIDEQNRYKAQLKLCMTWNRYDMAEKFIFNEENRDKVFGFLDEFFYDSILNDRVEFVQLFLENGFVVKNFLTYRRLLKLYNDIPKSSMLHKFLVKKSMYLNRSSELIEFMITQKERRDYVFTFKAIGEVIQELVDGFFKHRFCHLPFNKLSKVQCEKILYETDSIGKAKEKTVGIFNGLDKETEINIDQKCQYPEHELFMYCILLGRRELAEIFWSIGENCMCAALIASKILKECARRFEDKSVEFKECAIRFENLACETLQACSILNEDVVPNILMKKAPEFDSKTTLQAGIAAKDLNFVSHFSFQRLLVKLWFNRIGPDTKTFNLYFSMMVPFLAPFLVEYKDKQVKMVHKQNESDNESSEDEEQSEELHSVVTISTEKALKEMPNLPKQKEKKIEKSNSVATYFKDVLDFIRAPIVKFVYNQVFYIIFLLLFSYIILCDFNEVGYPISQTTSNTLTISAFEVVLIIWVCTFLMEECRKLVMTENSIWTSKIKTYLIHNWNFIVVFNIVLYFVALILRFIPNKDCYVTARILFSVNIIFWFIKSLTAYWFIKKIGPILILMEKMVIQLFYFSIILILFIFAFGVSTQAMMFPNQPLNKELLKNIFFPGFFVTAREYYTRSIIMNSDQCSVISPETGQNCPDEPGSDVSLAVYTVYIFLINLLFINLLIAVFNYKYTKIEENAIKIFRYQRYFLVYEYFFKPVSPPPLEFFSFCWLGVKWFVRFILRAWLKNGTNNNFKEMINQITKPMKLGFIIKRPVKNIETVLGKYESNGVEEVMSVRIKVRQQMDAREQNFNLINQKFDDLNDRIKVIEKKVDLLINHNMSHLNQDEEEKDRNEKPQNLTFSDTSPPNTSSFNGCLKESKNTVINVMPIHAWEQNDKPDPDLGLFEFNQFDRTNQVNRISFFGPYGLENGLPLNPIQKKGIKGRGRLFYWGPNHIAQCIFTKIAKDEYGFIELDDTNKPIVQVLARDYLNNNYEFPEILNSREDSDLAHKLATNFFSPSLFNSKSNNLYEQFKSIVNQPKKMESYIPASELNTDNAWIEYTVLNFHDNTGCFEKLPIKCETDLKWVDISKVISRLSADSQVGRTLSKIQSEYQII